MQLVGKIVQFVTLTLYITLIFTLISGGNEKFR